MKGEEGGKWEGWVVWGGGRGLLSPAVTRMPNHCKPNCACRDTRTLSLSLSLSPSLPPSLPPSLTSHTDHMSI